MSNDWGAGQNGGQQYPPQQGGQQYPPQQGGQQYPPQQGGQQYPPQGQQPPTAQVPPGGYYPPGGPGGPQGPGGPGAPGGKGKGKRFALIALLLTTITGLLVGGGLVLINRGNDTATESDDDSSYVIMETQAVSTQPVFEPRDARGDDPFYPLETQLVSFQQDAMEDAMEEAGDDADSIDPADFEVERLTEQTKTGLYGGTAENTCDPERLIAFLLANPELGEAWAEVQGIPFGSIPSYIRSLEVRVLAEPVAVLNHGYDTATGQAYEIDTVLDAGTAVLVDENGDVRTRCYCGNPIRPKPPVGEKPPACLVFPLQVYVEPGSDRRRLNAPGTVFLTGRAATDDDGRRWDEVMWGDEASEMGWTWHANLQLRRYCKPPPDTGKCPGPGEVPVWNAPDGNTQIGRLDGEVRTVDTTTTIYGTAIRVGTYYDAMEGVDMMNRGVVSNGRVFVFFTQPAPSIDLGGWVDLANLTNDPANCMPIQQCIDTEGPILQQAGGDAAIESGRYRVEFTGHFTVSPDTVQIRLLDGTGRSGWISPFYTPLADSDCENRPTTWCKAYADDLLDNLLFSSATASLSFPDVSGLPDDEAEAAFTDFLMQDFSVIRGFAGNVEVTLIGSANPTNGRVEVQLGQRGPTGWIEVSTLIGRACLPVEQCMTITGQIWSDYRDAGSVLAGTPSGGPVLVKFYEAGGIAWAPGAINPIMAGAIEDIHVHIEINGQRGWASFDSLAPAYAINEAHPNECDPPPPARCPSASTVAAVAIEHDECCIQLPEGPTLAAFTGRTRIIDGVEHFEAAPGYSINYVWVSASSLLPASDCETKPISCPTPQGGPSRIPGEGELTCCAVVDGEDGFEYQEVTLLGAQPVVEGPPALATVDDGLVNEADFVAAELCEEPPPEEPVCDDGLVEVRPDVCCVRGQEVVNGQCTDPCPTGQQRNSNGNCFTPCPTGQQRASDGSCITPCPTGEVRDANGECAPPELPCPTGEVRDPNGECGPPELTCPPGQEVVGGDRCCPTGTELLGNNCVEPCETGETRNDQGGCVPDCPRERLTVLSTCCPEGTLPLGNGLCGEPCLTQRDRVGTCCLNSETIDGESGLCVPLCETNVIDSQGNCCLSGQVDTGTGLCFETDLCPSGSVSAPNEGCCLPGEVVDIGGFCNDPCVNNNYNPLTGECCGSSNVPVGESCLPPCSSLSVRDALNECCPVNEPQSSAFINNQGICDFFA